MQQSNFRKLRNLNSKEIIKRFKKFGFMYITLDLEGYRTGSLNEVLNNEKDITRF